MGTLVVQWGAYHCSECLHQIHFDWVSTNSQLAPDGTAIGACHNADCERKGLRMRVKLQTIEVEDLHDYDGSGLNAEITYKALVEKGDAGVWADLEEFYHDLCKREDAA